MYLTAITINISEFENQQNVRFIEQENQLIQGNENKWCSQALVFAAV